MRVPDIDIGQYETYDEAYADFEWDVPETFNIAHAVCGQWADRPWGKRRVALFFEDVDGMTETYTFWQLRQAANRVANALQSVGVTKGTRVGVLLPQRPETLVANLGVLQAGAVVVPLSTLYGTEGLRYRLSHSGTEVVVVDRERAGTLADILPSLNTLETVVTLDDPEDVDGERWEDIVTDSPTTFDTVETAADDPAYVIYTSGTTGTPKGAHHAHRKLLGYIPGWQMINDFPGEEAVHYTPAGWSWVGGLFAVVWGAWFHGQPVLGYAGQFDVATTYGLLERYGVTNTLLTATMLRMMQEIDHTDYDLDLRVVPSGGETVTADLYEYVEEAWGAQINEIYGQTECNFLVGTNQRLMEMNTESAGKPCPGHRIAVIDEETGEPLSNGEIGHLAVGRPDPSMLLEYWDDPERTEELFVDDWMKTGDAGSRDAEGYIYYEGRADDVIITSGYRVSPLEVERTLREHDAVNDAVVVGVEDETRGTIVKAFLKLTAGVEPSNDLVSDIQSFVRKRAAAYEYPREVEFVAEFPTTVSGKIQRHKLTD